MFSFYGVCQLVSVKKIDKTKDNRTVVYFKVATNRGEDKTDFMFCKVYGNTADFFIRNLVKGEDGKYKSRKLFLDGNIETYNAKKEVECIANIKKEDLVEQYGKLYTDLKIIATTTTSENQFVFRVKELEFLDKKNEVKVAILANEFKSEEDKEDNVKTNSDIADAYKEYQDDTGFNDIVNSDYINVDNNLL